MDIVRCDVCGNTIIGKNRRSITVRKRKGFRVNYKSVGSHGLMVEQDAWPGADYWEPPIVPTPNVSLDFCGDDCLETGVRRLHDGCQLVAYYGLTLPVEVFAVAKVAAQRER